jgi:hypothetical protein
MNTIDTSLFGTHDYAFCMEERQQMLQRFASIPKGARENHWVAGDIPANTFAKSAAQAWLKHSIGRLRRLRQAH